MQTAQFQYLKLICFKSTLKEHLIGFKVVITKDKYITIYCSGACATSVG